MARIRTILLDDLDERPEDILDGFEDTSWFTLVIRDILEQFRDLVSQRRANVHLLKERAVLLIGEILWRQKQRSLVPSNDELATLLHEVSDSPETRQRILTVILDETLSNNHDNYLEYINQFLEAVNQQEMIDFQRAKDALLATVPRLASGDLKFKKPESTYRVLCPMRVGISSANASDNWTFSKLRGGVVLNFALDLSAGEGPPRPPIAATLRRTSEPGLILETISQLRTNRVTCVRILSENAQEFFAIAPGQYVGVEGCFKDIHDPLLLLKYAFVFCRIVGFSENPAGYLRCPARIIDDVTRFASGGGLHLTVESLGPSRAGFASSSCVALGLLGVLYRASAQEELTVARTLSSLALLFENELGLKSGKQDTDGPLYPGVKSIRYPKTNGFLESELTTLKLDESELRDNLVLVNSGIQRPAATGLRRGLNMRHYSYLSRDPLRFGAVTRSLDVHEQIVEAVNLRDWPKLGSLFTEYLDLRETIDSGATQSVFDTAACRKVLRVPFEQLLNRGLIHGGMYTGAMGGGCMMLVPTELGKSRAAQATTRLAEQLEQLKDFRAGDQRPFERLVVYDYAVNTKGLEYQERQLAT
jgi:galactokinase/mevalonate kinase-like predicted kinase